MSKHSSNEGPLVKNDSSERVSTESQSQLPTPSSNVFTSLIKKVPSYGPAVSPAPKRRTTSKGDQTLPDPNKRSAVSQMLHSVPGAVKKKFTRATNSPELTRWSSDEIPESEDPTQRRGNFRIVLEQLQSADTPILRETRLDSEPLDHVVMAAPYDPDNLNGESDDDNVEQDGLLPSFFGQITTVSDADKEIIKVKSEIEVTQRNNTELTKKYLEVSKTVSDSQLPDFATRETYNQKNLKSQKHVRELQKKLRNLEERKKKIKEQELMNNGYVQGENLLESPDTVERQKTPDHNRKTGVIHGVYKKAVAKRRKPRQDDKNWGSDGAIDQSSGVVELTEAITETISSNASTLRDLDPVTPESIFTGTEFSSAISDDEDAPHVTADEFENVSDRADSASNVSTDQVQENITKLRDDYANLLREVESLRETYRDSLTQITSSIEKQREYFVAALQDTTLRIRQIDDRVDDKLDQFHYSSDERVKDIEERLDNYKYKMTRFEELQEQRRMENPLTGTDIASRGRDVMSSVISLGLAMVSLVLFVFTTVVDCLKVFSENNALSTCLSLGLFGVIIAFYYYFEVGRTT